MPAQPKPVRDWRALDAAHRRRGELIAVFFSPDGGAFAPPEYKDKFGKPRTLAARTFDRQQVEVRLRFKALNGLAVPASRTRA